MSDDRASLRKAPREPVSKGAGEAAAPEPLVEGVDYTVDAQGRLVFTAHYNRRRGWCCFLACRHCPWGQAGRTPAQAFADLQRRLDALEARLEAAGLPLELRGYRNGVLAVQPPADACAKDHAALERAVLDASQGLLTVRSIAWN